MQYLGNPNGWHEDLGDWKEDFWETHSDEYYRPTQEDLEELYSNEDTVDEEPYTH